MIKPFWQFNFRFLKQSQFSFKLNWNICKDILWKDKFGTPRVELIPHYSFSWLWFQIDFIQGTDQDWEWYLWVTKFHKGDIEKAIIDWGWYDMQGNQSKPWLTYNK